MGRQFRNWMWPTRGRCGALMIFDGTRTREVVWHTVPTGRPEHRPGEPEHQETPGRLGRREERARKGHSELGATQHVPDAIRPVRDPPENRKPPPAPPPRSPPADLDRDRH